MMTKWRVWPNRSKSEDYYQVYLFSSAREMREFLREHRRDLGKKYFDDCHGFCEAIDVHGRRSRDRKWRSVAHTGSVFFSLDWMGADAVAHEMTHAAQWYMQRRHSWKPGRDDELLATAVEELVRGFWRGYEKRVKPKRTARAA